MHKTRFQLQNIFSNAQNSISDEKYLLQLKDFFAGIYSCKELEDMKPKQIILYDRQNLNP